MLPKRLLAISVAFVALQLTSCKKSGDAGSNEQLDSSATVAPPIPPPPSGADSAQSAASVAQLKELYAKQGVKMWNINGWNYRADTDKMRNQRTDLAYIESDNMRGPSVTIQLQRTGKKSDVVLKISECCFQTSSEGVNVTAKFDNHQIQRFTGEESDAGDLKVLFIVPSARFINELKKSSHVIVEAPFYESGRQQFTFSCDSLEW